MTDDATAALAAALHDAYCRQNVPMHRDAHSHDSHAIITALAAAGWAISEVHTWTLAAQRAGERAAVRAALEDVELRAYKLARDGRKVSGDDVLTIIRERVAALGD